MTGARRCITLIGPLCAWLVAASPASASDLYGEPAAPASGWQFNLTPYGWMINVNGDVTARGHTADINEDFFQIVEKSDSLLAWMSFFEARRGRFSFFTDLVWMDLGVPGHFQIEKSPLGRFDRATLDIRGKVQVDYESTIIQSGITYEITRWQGMAPGRYTALDLIGSARYWNQEVDVSLHLTGTLTVDFERLGLKFQKSRSVAIARSNDLEWVDPVVGARLRHQMAPARNFGSKAMLAVSAPAATSPGRWSALMVSMSIASANRCTRSSVTARFTSTIVRPAGTERRASTSCSTGR